MKLEEIKQLVQSKSYDFLRDNPRLGNNIILLGLGGSHAYGTETPTSDLDIRGVTLNNKFDLLTNQNFEQVENTETDTVVYSFNKIITLLSNCNPNTIELAGLKPEHYLYISPIGRELLDNKKLFLSKMAVHSFGGYANQQLRRLDNKAARDLGQAQREQHILNSINNASYDFKNKYMEFPDDSIKLYLDDAIQEDFDKEIFMDINLTHYPLRDYKSMWSEMQEVVKAYAKFGRRNKHAVEHGKLTKHMMHLVRLYLMCFDILEREEIITYREYDLPFLNEVRAGKYLDVNNQPTEEFLELIDSYEKRLNYAKNNTSLPESPDYKKINEFMASVNERVIKGDI